METITIKQRGELQDTKKPGIKKFEVEDTQGRCFVCFSKQSFHKFNEGAVVEVEVIPSKYEDGLPMIKLHKEEEKPKEESKRQPTAPDTRDRNVDLGWGQTISAPNTRDRSMALSYAKDLVVAGKLSLEEMFLQAEKNYKFVMGELRVDDAKIAEDILTKPVASPAKPTNPVRSMGKENDDFAVWLATSLPKINWKIPTAVSWVNRKGGKVRATTIEELVSQLNELTWADLKEEIERRLKQ